MAAMGLNMRYGAQLFVLTLLCACSLGPVPQEPVMTAQDQVVRDAAAEVDKYIADAKHWKKATYEIILNRMEGVMLVFWAVHSEDKLSKTPGAGKSVEIYFDAINNRVVKELAFQ